MHRLNGLTALVAASMALAGLPGRAAARVETEVELARSSVSRGRSLEYATELTAIGPRVTGSPGYARAAQWAADRFRAMGIARVAMEPFTIERGWERVSARGRLTAPDARLLHLASLGWSPSTPEGGIDADVIALANFSFDAPPIRQMLQGRIVLLPDGDPPSDADPSSAGTRGLGARLRAAGALAILAPDGDPDNVLTARGLGFGTAISALPAAQIGREEAEAIRGLLRSGRVGMSLELNNRITPAAALVDNVTAEIVGRDRPDEWVVVGAHLDSWDFGTGAQDNATGVAMVLEAARAIAALPQRPRRSIRFALWGGEEQGQLGSTAYALAHAAELDRIVADLNTDAGTGRIIGWTAPGRSDVIRAARALTHAVLDELAAGQFDDSLRYAFQSDGAPFILAGIPTLDLNADDTTYEAIHHKAADTIDRVDARQLAVGAAAVASTTYAIADGSGRFAPRLDARAVERMRQRHKGE